MNEPAFIDTTDATFETDVIERSRTTPVVVDFWAPWCGPCRSLGPVLERIAEERRGEVLLVKVNIDENPRVASALGVQSIPLVIAFRDGQAVAEFTGAQPEGVVRQLFDRLAPSEADRLASAGTALLAAGDAAEGEQRLRDALQLQPGHGGASLALARQLATAGKGSEALEVLERAVASGADKAAIDQLEAQLRVAEAGAGDLSEVRARAAAAPDDLAAQLDLGRALAAGGKHEEALETFLALVRRDPAFDDGAARKAMLDLFTVLGRDNPLVDRLQRDLAAALFR